MKIHFIGDEGVSMRALKALARSRGCEVSGSDGARGGHDPKNVEHADIVVYTNAIPKDNCELVRAVSLGIPVIERAQYLGELSRAYKKTLAVAGCHGKSTTTAMLGSIFPRDDATVHVGIAGASRVGGDKYFVTEACEYNRSFLALRPSVGVILNIGYDHPDCYATFDALVDAYAEFAKNCETVIVNGDDPNCRKIAPNAITFGVGEQNAYRARNIVSENGYRTFEFVHGTTKRKVALSVPGAHNVMNALAALAAADVCGIAPSVAGIKLGRFCGAPRRFERIGIAYGKTVFTDYAHHPDEIAATIATAREMFPSVAVVFQPHTYTRTQALCDEFAQALAKADNIILAPIFAAREKPINGVSSQTVCDKISELGFAAAGAENFDEIIELCKPLKEKALLFVGAGDINTVAERFVHSE